MKKLHALAIGVVAMVTGWNAYDALHKESDMMNTLGMGDIEAQAYPLESAVEAISSWWNSKNWFCQDIICYTITGDTYRAQTLSYKKGEGTDKLPKYCNGCKEWYEDTVLSRPL